MEQLIIIAENKDKVENIDLSKYKFETVESSALEQVEIEVQDMNINDKNVESEDTDDEDYFCSEIDSDSEDE